jgi:hypothetical protein
MGFNAVRLITHTPKQEARIMSKTPKSISKEVYQKVCKALYKYDQGKRNPVELYDALEAVYQEWEYIQNKE